MASQMTKSQPEAGRPWNVAITRRRGRVVGRPSGMICCDGGERLAKGLSVEAADLLHVSVSGLTVGFRLRLHARPALILSSLQTEKPRKPAWLSNSSARSENVSARATTASSFFSLSAWR